MKTETEGDVIRGALRQLRALVDPAVEAVVVQPAAEALASLEAQLKTVTEERDLLLADTMRRVDRLTGSKHED